MSNRTWNIIYVLVLTAIIVILVSYGEHPILFR